jgi:hypothetical protein
MPSNSTGTIAIWRDASGAATVNLSVQETGVRVRAVPAGGAGTTVDLPTSDPTDGDCYEILDADGSASTAKPIVIVPPAGTTIRGAANFSLVDAFASVRVTFDASADDWTVEESAGGGSTSVDAPWHDVAAGTVFQSSSATPYVSCDSTAAQSTVKLDPAPVDGQVQIVRLTGTTQVTPVLVLPQGAGITVEDVVNLGTFDGAGGTFLAIQCELASWKFDKATKQWKLYAHTVGAASGALNAASWAVDYAAGLNSNSGAVGHPLADVAEVRRRWNGGVAGTRPTLPGISIAVAITGDVPNATQFADPISVLWDLDASLGLNLQITFASTVKRAGTILAVPNAFARTATGEQTVTDAGVADWTSDVDHLLQVTTGGKHTVCWVTRPLAAPARGVLSSAYDSADSAPISTAIDLGLTADTVAIADTYNVLTLAKCYLGRTSQFRIAPGSADTGATGQANVVVVNAHGLSQGATDVFTIEADASFFDGTQFGGAVSFVNCQIDQARQVEQGGVYFFNCFTPAIASVQDVLSSPYFSGVILSGYARRTIILLNNWTVDQDFFMIGGGSNQLVAGDAGGASQGCIIGDYGHFLHGGGASTPVQINRAGMVAQIILYGAQAVWYGETGGAGQAVLSMNPFAHYSCANATAAASWVFDQGAGAFVKMGAANQNGVFWNLATSTYLPVGGLANTITNIDAARPGGFAGQFSNPDLSISVAFGS